MTARRWKPKLSRETNAARHDARALLRPVFVLAPAASLLAADDVRPGFADAARTFYGRIEEPRPGEPREISTYALAERRLAALDAPQDAP